MNQNFTDEDHLHLLQLTTRRAMADRRSGATERDDADHPLEVESGVVDSSGAASSVSGKSGALMAGNRQTIRRRNDGRTTNSPRPSLPSCIKRCRRCAEWRSLGKFCQ